VYHQYFYWGIEKKNMKLGKMADSGDESRHVSSNTAYWQIHVGYVLFLRLHPFLYSDLH
jgi:hypothetical protein